MKVYCINCKYCPSCEWNFGCLHKSNIEYLDYSTPLKRTVKKSYSFSIMYLNANNDCANYKRKWWKFWIK